MFKKSRKKCIMGKFLWNRLEKYRTNFRNILRNDCKNFEEIAKKKKNYDEKIAKKNHGIILRNCEKYSKENFEKILKQF